MKKAILIVFTGLLAITLRAATIVQIANPETWWAGELSKYVGKEVTFSVPMVICSNGTWSSSSLTVSPRRVFSPTNQAYPLSPEYNEFLTINGSGSFSLTDVPSTKEGKIHRMGEKIVNLTVKVNSANSCKFISGSFVGNTREDLAKGPDMSMIDMNGKHSILVCAMNCEYYLTDYSKWGANDNTTGMGPTNKEQHKKQQSKVSSALALIQADIYGLVEIQQGNGAIAEIASDLTKKTGKLYDYIRTGTSADGTYTQSGYVYRTDKVEPLFGLQSIDDVVKNRKKMQVFREKATGEKFIFSLNHFKAKSNSGSGKDANKGDGQGSFNYSRVREAMAVYNNYSIFSQQVDDPDILIMGDLNAYAKEDPITQLTKSGMTDLHRYFHADSSYSYTFSGQAGYLDHALANTSLLPQVTGMTPFHINSDENDIYTYDSSSDLTMFRCSDHDPVLVGLKLDSTITYNPNAYIGAYEVYKGDKQLVIRNATSESNPAYCRIITIDGRLVTQEPILNNDFAIDTPQHTGLYIVYVYSGDGKVYSYKILVP